MAEAHSAVAFSFAITRDGVNISYDRDMLWLVWQSGAKAWKKRIARTKTNLSNGIFPASLSSLAVLLAIVSGLYYYENPIIQNLIKLVASKVPGRGSLPDMAIHVGCALVSLSLWLTLILMLRYTIKLLLTYKGWMREVRRNTMSLKTKFWGMSLKLLLGSRKHLLYDFQASLPRLPLPPLKNTIEKYLDSMRPLLDENELNRRTVLAKEFLSQGLGDKCQRYLRLKSWWSSNYVTDWWEEYVYLRGRSPLLINSNYYGIDALELQSAKQSSRAAFLIYASFMYRRSIDSQTLPPLLIQNIVPLCSRQNERMFNTTRIPGIETDRIDHYEESYYIVVYCRGSYYKLPVYNNTRLLSPAELEMQIDWILSQQSKPDPGEAQLAALTSVERKRWSNTRKEFFKTGLNRASLRTIEKAAFVVVLEDQEHFLDVNDTEKFNKYTQSLFYGNGSNRWLDKSFNLIVFSNGRVGLNVEHSWADAPIMAQFWEVILTQELTEPIYNSDGRINGQAIQILPTPKKLRWNFDEKILNEIDDCVQLAEKMCKDIDLKLFISPYGKGFIKKCKVSPDAYVQMALQLAYYRDSGRFCLTYEASMTRLYREGRTETVRTVTPESCAWAKAMTDPNSTKEERKNLLHEASTVHQKGYLASMCGEGIDRHLFCLYVVSKYLNQQSPFLEAFISDQWRLSTSQTPHNQAFWTDAKKYPNHICGGGGFGPVTDDGYGVCYLIAGENMIFFHVSSKVSSPKTDTQRFLRNLKQSFVDLKELFTEDDVVDK